MYLRHLSAMTGRTRLGTALAALAAQAITLGLLVGPLIGQPWPTGFRHYFSNDQLSYAAIAANVSNGHAWFVEPFTQTGNLYYPSLWYQLLGLVSRISGWPVATSWTIIGVVLVCFTVLAFGLAAVRMTRWWWTPALPGIALLTGTLSTVGDDYWYTALEHHAVLWGPFGTLFALNAEVAGICFGALGLLALLAAGTMPGSRRRTVTVLVGAGVLIGATANLHSYAFFTSTSLVALWAWTYGLLWARSRRLTLGSIALLLAVLVAGSWVASLIGQTFVFALLLLALLPPLVLVARRKPALVAAFVIPLTVVAAPQIVRTALGLAAQDPFLVYRQASTEALGVPPWVGIVGASVLVLIWLACIVAPGKDRLTTALLVAIIAGLVLMAGNDRWGFTQEPYRFFTQYLIVGLLLLSVLAPLTLRSARGSRARMVPSYVAAGLAVLVFAISLGDVVGFWRFAREQGVFDTSGAAASDLAAATQRDGGLITAGPCVDMQQLKLVSAGPVTYFNRGMAWPTDPERIAEIMSGQQASGPDLVLLREAGVEYIVTDTTCSTPWQFTPRDRVVPVRQVGDFRLWQILPG